MNVLVACEFSGSVRNAFSALGHTAFSCDLLPTESNGRHYQCDLRWLLAEPWTRNWDLIVAHPPCTYLTTAGNAHFSVEKYGHKAIERVNRRRQAIDFVNWLWELPCPRMAIENPIGCLTRCWEKPTQIIHPYQFGDPQMKATCLWLRGLPKLVPTSDMCKPMPSGKTVRRLKDGTKIYKNRYFTDTLRDPHERSRTFQGIAQAMAQQWG